LDADELSVSATSGRCGDGRNGRRRRTTRLAGFVRFDHSYWGLWRKATGRITAHNVARPNLLWQIFEF
jgi:hypothetical protein